MRTLTVLAVLLSIPTGALGDAERWCTRAKLRAAAEYVRAYYGCYADGAAAGGEPDTACLFAAGDVFRTAVAAADSRGPCDGTPNELAIAFCVPSIGAGDPACREAKFHAASRRFVRWLACHGGGLRREGARPRCFARVENRFAKQIAAADALGTCGGTAGVLSQIVDRCALRMATALSCGNGRLDYGESCEGDSDFCGSCHIIGGECCVTTTGCFQFSGPIEFCYLDGGIDIQPGLCTPFGCVADIPISATPFCCQQQGETCTGAVAGSALELGGLVATCNGSGYIAVVGTCGADGRCVAASDPPVALSTTTTAPPTTTTVFGPTTTTIPFPLCTDIGAACGQCGNGTCMAGLPGIPIGACVMPDAVGPCSPNGACAENEICIVGQCHTFCH